MGTDINGLTPRRAECKGDGGELSDECQEVDRQQIEQRKASPPLAEALIDHRCVPLAVAIPAEPPSPARSSRIGSSTISIHSRCSPYCPPACMYVETAPASLSASITIKPGAEDH